MWAAEPGGHVVSENGPRRRIEATWPGAPSPQFVPGADGGLPQSLAAPDDARGASRRSREPAGRSLTGRQTFVSRLWPVSGAVTVRAFVARVTALTDWQNEVNAMGALGTREPGLPRARTGVDRPDPRAPKLRGLAF
jgi:hypothetical protein